MGLFRTSLAIAITLAICASSPAHAETINALFLGDNGSHVPKQRFAELQPVLQSRGIELTYTDKVADLNPKTLSKYAALVLYANIDVISKPQSRALLDYVSRGGGFVPIHCATFCFRNDPEIVALMGAQFQRGFRKLGRDVCASPPQ